MISIVVCVIAVILSFLKVALLEHEEDKVTKSDKDKGKEV